MDFKKTNYKPPPPALLYNKDKQRDRYEKREESQLVHIEQAMKPRSSSKDWANHRRLRNLDESG